MRDLFRLIGWTIVDHSVAGSALAKIWTLRQQINVLRRTAPKRLSFSVFDHLVFVGLYRLSGTTRGACVGTIPHAAERLNKTARRLTPGGLFLELSCAGKFGIGFWDFMGRSMTSGFLSPISLRSGAFRCIGALAP